MTNQFKDFDIEISLGHPLGVPLIRHWFRLWFSNELRRDWFSKQVRDLLIRRLYGSYDRATGSNASPASCRKIICKPSLWHIIAPVAGRRPRDLIVRPSASHSWGVGRRRHRLWWGHTYIRFGFKTSKARKKGVLRYRQTL